MLPQPPPMGAPPIFEPKRIKIFGIIHIVFGGMGLLRSVFGVIMMFFQEWFTRLTSEAQGQSEELVELQIQMQRDLAPFSWISLGVGIVVSILVLRAGLALVRRRKTALKSSNTYVWASIFAKALGFVLFFVVVGPILNQTFEGLIDPSISGATTVINTMKITTMVAGVVIPLVAAIYPVMTLIMLNKPDVKEFLNQQGT